MTKHGTDFSVVEVSPNPNLEPLLQIQSVSQSFRTGFFLKRTEVLKDISFDVQARSVFGFLGPNGAGKTTLIHLITGIRKPKSGQILFRGVSTQEPAARLRIGYLPERPYFHEHLTGEGFLRYFGALSGLSVEQVERKIPLVLESVGISRARKVELKRYSKGMLQRIGIAQAILHDPELLVLDEPMSGLDPIGRKEIRELILRLASEGRTVFFSSHVIPDVEAICDQVAVIERGAVRAFGPISGFLDRGGSQSIEVALGGVDALSEVIEGDPANWGVTHWRPMPQGLRVTLEGQDRLKPFLARSLARPESRILWVNPIRPSLEDVFEVKSGGPV